MTLLMHGYGEQPANWHVDEAKASGFSRVYYITGGDVFYSDNKQAIKLKNGCLYIFPSSKGIKLSHDKNNPLCCLWFHLNLFPTIVTDLIEVLVEPDESLYHLLLSLKHQFLDSGGRDSYFLSLINSLSTYFYENKLLPIPDDGLVSILSYINAQYMTAISVEEISEHFHYTTEHFIRMFQKKASITPYQYLTNCKMTEAVRLLSIGTPVSQAAISVGYADSKTFSHAFKLRFNIPPSKYIEYYKPMA